jgi:superfamily I DNA/RNA helicase
MDKDKEKEMNATQQQQDIYDYITERRKNIAVNALAGAGKTTTAVQAARYAATNKNVGFTAFNKHIAQELQERLGSTAQASTIHALGKRILTSHGQNHEIDGQKYHKVHKQLFPNAYDHRGKLLPDFQGVIKLCDIFRNGLIDINENPEKQTKQLRKLADLQGWEFPKLQSMFVEQSGQVMHMVKTGLESMNTIDFTDMVSAPSYLGLAKSQYDFLICDEAQDFNAAQQKLVTTLGERIMFVGDPNQAIMLFAGADARSFSTLRRELNATELPLSICWRCPSSHLDLARYLVPEIEDRPGAIEGEYEETVASALPRMVRPGEMVICRANAPLLSLAYSCVNQGIPVMIRGRNIGSGLADIVKKLKPNSTQELSLKLKNYRTTNYQRLVDREASDSTIQAHLDACDCLDILSESHDNVFEILEAIEKLFCDSDDSEKVILSSVHRSKGSECDTVYILAPHLLGRKGKNEDATIQEVNLAYVALTRAKRRLVLAEGAKSKRPETREWLAGMARSVRNGQEV